MEVSRRSIFAAIAVAGANAIASPASGCSITAHIKPRPHDDAACRASLARFVAAINSAPHLSPSELNELARTLPVEFDSQIQGITVPKPAQLPVERADILNGWTLHLGKRDTASVSVREIHRLKSSKGLALYQFTLRRDVYYPGISEEQAAEDSCGALAVAATYLPKDNAYIGVFVNNVLRKVDLFDLWLTELP